ncbi:lytic transglycosylase domain-containing protein [Actinomadura latina]|uniref:Lytic transglycosylase domain-containing protein n=1 Tax=Actinomadura latina TaxID=163603 RepID=A0A846Z0J5_9ACTN|nr:lytic transglycosylase domain-containing protein [Actinomadura latina]NKZ06359.1 lytic transglycosylase domain-containing protein [Actinomadura latina]
MAGSDRTRIGAPAGDTLGFQAMPPRPMRTGVSATGPHDEIGSDRRGPQGGSGGSGRRNGMRIVAVAAGAAVVIGGGAAAAFALTGGSGGSGGDRTTLKPTRQQADAAAPKVDPKVLEQQRRDLALERASRKTREDSSKGPSLLPKGKPIPTKTPEKKKSGGGSGPVGDPVPKGEAQEIAKKLMPSFGFTGDGQFGCLVNLWDRESGWNTHAANPSGAYGIPQALPGSKMGSAGPDWQNNATTQIKWGLGYIKDRYKTPCGGWSHFQSVGWY